MTIARPALFLDRDGVINVDQGFVSRPQDFVWIDGAKDCIKAFNARGWYVFVVTNQSGIAFELYSQTDMQSVHAHMITDLEDAGGHIDRIYFSPWHPEASDPAYRKDSSDRKPGPGMLLQAMADFKVDREKSFLIGDKPTDTEAAEAAGVSGYLFEGGNLNTFAEWALAAKQAGAR